MGTGYKVTIVLHLQKVLFLVEAHRSNLIPSIAEASTQPITFGPPITAFCIGSRLMSLSLTPFSHRNYRTVIKNSQVKEERGGEGAGEKTSDDAVLEKFYFGLDA